MMTIVTKLASGQVVGEFSEDTYKAAGLEYLLKGLKPAPLGRADATIVGYVSSDIAGKLHAAQRAQLEARQPVTLQLGPL